MSRITRVLTALLMALTLTTAAFAAPPSDIKATIKVYRWGTDLDIRQVEAATARFKKRYPNVTVVVQYGNNNPWSDYISQFMNIVASGDAPDICTMPIEGIATVASRVPLVDLEELLEDNEEAQAMLADIEPNITGGLRWNGKLRFFPFEWNNVVVYYNVDLFEEAGVPPPSSDWTWDDMLEAAKKLTKRDANGHTSQYGLFLSGIYFTLAPWFMTNDTNVLTPDWRAPNVKDPKFAETLSFLYDLINVHKVAPSFAKNDVGIGAFVSGNAAMFLAGRWPTPDILDSKINFDVQYFPQKRKQVTVYGIGGNCILESSANPELAWEYVKEISGYEFQDELAKTYREIPSLKSIANRPDQVNVPKNGHIFYDSAATAEPIASPPGFAAVEEIFIRHLEAYLTGNESQEDAIAAMDRELTRAMGRVKW